LNDQLISELPLLVDLRIREPSQQDSSPSDTFLAYLDPSFEAMIRCQLRFAEEGYEKLSGVQRSASVHLSEVKTQG
jgi:hypothetical protein